MKFAGLILAVLLSAAGFCAANDSCVTPNAITFQPGVDYVYTGSGGVGTLPAASNGLNQTIKNAGSGTLILAAAGSDTLWNTSSVTAYNLTAGQSVTLLSEVNKARIYINGGSGGGTTLTDSASLRTALSDEVGTGAAYFVGGALGTPASVTLTNGTGLPPAGVTGTAAILGANTFTAKQTITQASANAGIIASTGYSLTGSTATNMVDYAGTWNTSGNPTAFKINITIPASGATSLLMDLQASGVSKFKVDKSGVATASSFVADSYGDASGTAFSTQFGLMRINANKILLGGSDDCGINRVTVGVSELYGYAYAGNGTTRAVAITPAQITSNQNNYDPGGNAEFQRWSSDASRNVTGLTFATAAQVSGQKQLVVNVGAQNIVLVNESASSTAANRFTNSTAADITLSANQAADLIYDSTTSRWRVFKRN